MERIEIIPSNDVRELTFLYRANEDEANLLRRSIMGEIPCYAIDNVNFFTREGYHAPVNTKPENIAHRLGQCPIDQKLLPEITSETVYKLNVTSDSGIRIVTTRDIKDLPIVGVHEIVRLKLGEHLDCDIRLKRSNANEHMKFMVTSTVGMKVDPQQRGYILTCELTGQYDAREVLDLAIIGLNTVLDFPAENMFYKLPKPL